MRIKSVVFSFSILLAAFGLGQTFSKLEPQVRRASNASEAADLLLPVVDIQHDDYLRGLLLKADAHPDSKSVRDELINAVQLRARIERPPEGDTSAESVRRIQSNPLYRKVDERRTSNWIGDTFDKLGKLIPKIRQPEMQGGPDSLNFESIGAILRVLAWLFLGGVLVTFLVFAIRYWNFKLNLTRRASAVLEEDEPERSLDEWLAMANDFENQGRYREAIRCLYLACLLRFDEADVARFVRSHTNWEHLARIQSSPKNPGIDFLPLTKAFDLAWYGFRVKGAEDVVLFRDGYRSVTLALGGKV